MGAEPAYGLLESTDGFWPMRAEMAWTLMSSLARLDKGMASVGLNAVVLVTANL